jgi:hypothetical protein
MGLRAPHYCRQYKPTRKEGLGAEKLLCRLLLPMGDYMQSEMYKNNWSYLRVLINAKGLRSLLDVCLGNVWIPNL